MEGMAPPRRCLDINGWPSVTIGGDMGRNPAILSGMNSKCFLPKIGWWVRNLEFLASYFVAEQLLRWNDWNAILVYIVIWFLWFNLVTCQFSLARLRHMLRWNQQLHSKHNTYERMSYLYGICGMYSHEFYMLVYYYWTSFSSMFIYTYVCTCFKCCCFLRYGNIQMSIPYLIYLDSYGEIANFDSTKTWQQQTWHLQCNIFGKWSKQGASVPPPCSCTPKLSPLQVAIRREECLKSTTAAHGFHHGPWSSQACENPWAFAMYLWLVFVGPL